MKDVLIIRSASVLHPESIKILRRNILKQIESGVVVIPAQFEAQLINVPDDIEVVIETGVMEEV